jgi:hypothetical protein
LFVLFPKKEEIKQEKEKERIRNGKEMATLYFPIHFLSKEGKKIGKYVAISFFFHFIDIFFPWPSSAGKKNANF